MRSPMYKALSLLWTRWRDFLSWSRWEYRVCLSRPRGWDRAAQGIRSAHRRSYGHFSGRAVAGGQASGTQGIHIGRASCRQGLPLRTIAAAAVGQNDNEVYWSGDRKTMYIRVPESYGLWASARTYALPLPAVNIWPKIPAGGFQSEA